MIPRDTTNGHGTRRTNKEGGRNAVFLGNSHSIGDDIRPGGNPSYFSAKLARSEYCHCENRFHSGLVVSCTDAGDGSKYAGEDGSWTLERFSTLLPLATPGFPAWALFFSVKTFRSWHFRIPLWLLLSFPPAFEEECALVGGSLWRACIEPYLARS